MDYLTFIGVLSTICSILSFFTSKVFKSKIWIWIIVVFLQSFACGYIVYKNSELERIKNIHRQANAIYEHYVYGYDLEFIEECLVFLEENNDRYPDAYKRASQIYSDMKSPDFQYSSDAAAEMRGILKGLATMNDE